MSEIITPPAKGKWAVHHDRTEADLKVDLAASGYRLISIKTYLAGSTRLFAACSVENAGVTTDWTARMTEGELKAKLAADGGRLVSLDAYGDDDGNTFCAAVWVKNDGRWWDWRVDVTSTALRGTLADDHGKLTCLRVYEKVERRPLPFEEPEVSRCCAAVWVKDDGAGWSWSADIDGEDLYLRLRDGPLTGHTIVSYDSFADGGATRFAYVTWAGVPGSGWFWFSPVAGARLTDQVRGLCCYPMDVCRTHPADFAVVQYRYPPVAHPTAKKLLDFGGTGVIKPITDDLFQEISGTVSATNLTATPVTISKAARIFAGPGGWSWFDLLKSVPPGAAFGTPTSVVPATPPTVSTGFGYGSSYPMAHLLTQVEASGGPDRQQAFACLPLAVPGVTPPPPLPDLKAPVFVGLQGPLEILRLTDGRRLLEVKGHVVNLSGRPMHVRGVFVRLATPANTTAYHAILPLKFKLDYDPTGAPLKPPGPTEIDYDAGDAGHLVTPLPRFRHLVPVPNGFTAGTFEVELHIQSTSFYADADPATAIGSMECFADQRTFPVAEGAVLQISSPVKGTYKWGSGPCSSDWNAHWPYHERYAYDVVRVERDKDGSIRETKKGTDGTHREDSLSWDEKVFSAGGGTVVFKHDTEADHPDVGAGTTANMVVVQDGNLRYIYVHLKKGSVPPAVTLGASVTVGQEIGRIGHNGNSSGPHLHFGVYTHEPIGTTNPTGVLRPLALSLTPVLVAHAIPVVVPIDGAILDS